MPDIVCLGEPLVEFNQPRTGGDWRQGFGGDTSNAAIAAARQGTSVGYISRVGADAFGDMLRALWAAEGVDASAVAVDPAAPTGLYFVNHGEGGHRFSYRRAGSAASLMSPANLPVDAVRSARVLHLSAISQAISASACDACFTAIAAAREAGVTVSYDTNLRLALWPLPRARAVVEATLRQADIALPGLDDAIQLCGLSDPDAVADWFLGLGVKIVALTMGEDGTLLATADRRERIAARRVELVDATGAGDAFDGAFLSQWLATGDAFAAARHANAAAALSVTGYGAIAPLPRRADVEAFLRGG